VLAEHQWIIAQYPEEAQIDVWGEDSEAVASSSLAPREAARRMPGGWRLSGRYPFSSGCDYAQWAIIGAFLGEKGNPRSIAYLLVPLAEAEIVDDWQALGLLGTRSKSLVLHDVFVPEHRSVMVSDLFAGTPLGRAGAPRLSGIARAARVSGVVFAAAGRHRARPPRPPREGALSINYRLYVQIP
jgi:alkylation response protein AidB-like acyl-CoA dehydrogenase